MQAPAWPELREELALYVASPASDGSPAWSIHDPVRNTYFRIDWPTFEILSRWDLRDAAAIVDAIGRDTTLGLDPETVEDVARFLVQSELVRRDAAQQARSLATEQQRRQTGWLNWLLHHYLFFRVPLWRPDRWLDRTVGLVGPLYSRTFVLITLAALAFGLVQVSQQWGRFTASLVDLFTVQGLLAYGATLVVVKFLHELGHAFTAKRMGCKVPTMGVAFLVMFPMAYTDVNDAWKLASRRQRLQVGAAGIVTELMIACWATLAWSLLPDGSLRQGAFLLATTTWISTLVINASPFMRFDGYFLLMDWLDMPNLHQRAGAMARWHLRRLLFGLPDAAPEALPPHRQRFLIVFAYLTWVYRAVVFLGIALLVYYFAPKPLGPLLAAVELAWFIALPVWSELRVWGERWRDIAPRGRSWLTLLVMAGLGLIALLPWDSRVATQGLLLPADRSAVATPGAAQLVELSVPQGSRVAAGDVLARLQTPDVQHQRQMVMARAAGVEWQARSAGLENRLRERQTVIESERQRIGAEVAGLGREMDRYVLRAPIAGTVRWADPDVQPGQWLAKNAIVALVDDTTDWQVVAYLTERDLARVRPGDSARFVAESAALGAVALRVARIDTDATRVLGDGMLASTHGGDVLVREQDGLLVPEAGIYRVTLSLAGDAALEVRQRMTEMGAPSLRGRLVIHGTPRAWGEDYWLTAMGLLRRESGF